MSEYLRHTAEHVSRLAQQKRREAATAGQLAARIHRIFERRGIGRGLAGVLGRDEVRRSVGIVRPARAQGIEPASAQTEPAEPEAVEQEPEAVAPPESEPAEPEAAEPEPEAVPPPEPEPEAVEPTEPEAIEPEPEAATPPEPEPVEPAEPESIEPEPEAVAPPEPEPEAVEPAEPETIEPEPEAVAPPEPEPEAVEPTEPEAIEPEPEAVAPPEPEPAVEEPLPEPVEEHESWLGTEVELDIKEAAAEAAAVEEIRAQFAEEALRTGAPGEQAAIHEEPEEDDETADLAEVVADIQDARPESPPAPAGAVPGVAPPGDEVPFEAALEPRALIPAHAKFASSADQVLFGRAIERLGVGEMRSVHEGIELLGKVGGDTAASTLMNLYRIAPQHWRVEVAHRLVTHGGTGIAEFFCWVLDEGHEPAIVRVAALRALFARDKALAADYLLRAVADPSAEVRAAAATYLGWLRDQRAVPLLEQLMGDASQRVAKAAVHAATVIRS